MDLCVAFLFDFDRKINEHLYIWMLYGIKVESGDHTILVGGGLPTPDLLADHTILVGEGEGGEAYRPQTPARPYHTSRGGA